MSNNQKMWAGRFEKPLNSLADDFNSSLSFDRRMYRQDITGSIAHAGMLAKQGIITPDDAIKISDGLRGILEDIDSGKLEIVPGAEDIHMFVEAELTARIGDVGKKLHTARSRNDQVALDLRMYLRDEADSIVVAIQRLMSAIVSIAEQNIDAIMPGYTHLQRAQPILFSHHIMAYSYMFYRDVMRICDAGARMNESPLGSCALAGTTYDTDRLAVAEELGFDGITQNSIDGVSDRDFCLELMSALSILMMHMSRFAEEVILWSSWEFGFIELDDSYTTGSSIMPQKKNPDMAELVRGKTGRVYGHLIGLLTTMKGLPLAYNKDMQEDKEAVFDCCDTVKMCLGVFTPMIATMKVRRDNMKNAARRGFINATDLADYLVGKGIPFRSAYNTVGRIVGYAVKHGQVLEDIPLDIYESFDSAFGEDVYDAIDLVSCVRRRTSAGGTGKSSVEKQIAFMHDYLANVNNA